MAGGRKKVSTTVYLTTDQAEDLALLSERTKVPQAVFIRDAIQALLDAHRERGTLPSGDPGMRAMREAMDGGE